MRQKPSPSALPHQRESGLDGLRGLAALSVALAHYTCSLAAPHYDISALPTFFATYGHYGVQLFFIISGFVIFQTLLAKRNLAEFSRARFLRLFPTYWLCLALTSCVLVAAGSEFGTVTIAKLLSNGTMIAGQLTGPHTLMDGSYWTLEHELYFYVAAGVTFFLRGPRWAIGSLAFMAALGFIWNVEGVSGWLQSLPYPIPALSRRLSSILLLNYAHLFLIGIFIHRICQRNSTANWAMLGACIVCAFASHGTLDGAVTAGLTCAVLFSVTPIGRALIGCRMLTALGCISYPLYLLHQEIGYYCIALLNRTGVPVPVGVLICLVAMMLLAFAVERHVEPPVRRWFASLSARST